MIDNYYEKTKLIYNIITYFFDYYSIINILLNYQRTFIIKKQWIAIKIMK